MNKKLITACLALVAFAAMAVVPALASASPVLTNGSTPVVTGSKILGKNTGNTKFTTSIGTVECTNAKMTGTLTVNSGTSIEGDIETAEFNNGSSTSPCTTNFLGNVTVTPKRLPWCIKAKSTFTADTFQLSSGACAGGGTMEFILDSSTVGPCTYISTGTPPITGTFTTGTGTLKTEKQGAFTKSEGGIGCPSGGELDMTFDLYLDNEAETALKIS